MKRENRELAEQIMRLSNTLIFLEKKSIIEHGHIKLHPSEIHLMNVIAEERGRNASAMASRLGVTKGAVSQTLSRLEKKGIIFKTKDPQNKNELTVYFTSLGKNLLKQHHEMRASLRKRYDKYFSNISKEERDIIINFLKKMNEFCGTLK